MVKREDIKKIIDAYNEEKGIFEKEAIFIKNLKTTYKAGGELDTQYLLKISLQALIEEFKNPLANKFAKSLIKNLGYELSSVANLLNALRETRELLNPETIAIILDKKLDTDLALIKEVSSFLKEPSSQITGITQQEVAQKILNCKNIREVLNSLNKLSKSQLLSKEHFDLLISSTNPRAFVDSLIVLKNEDALRWSESPKAIAEALGKSHEPSALSKVFLALQRKGILITEEIIKAVAKNDYRSDLPEALGFLRENIYQLSPEQCDQIEQLLLSQNNYPFSILEALAKLYNSKMDVTAEMCELVSKHHSPTSLADALIKLEENGILKPDVKSLIIQYVAKCPFQHLDQLTQALIELKNSDLLNHQTHQLIANHKKPLSLLNALKEIDQSGLETKLQIHDVIAMHENPDKTAKTLVTLSGAQLLNDDILTHQNLEKILAVLQPFLDQGLPLTQQNLQQIVNYADILYPLRNDIQDLTNLPIDRVFYAIAYRCEAAQGDIDVARRSIETYFDRLQQQGAEPNADEDVPIFNDAQSTHITSVEVTASQSATRLYERYGKETDFNVDKALQEILAWSKELPKTKNNDDVNKAAQAAIERIIGYTEKELDYREPRSGISTTQLLAAAWKAIHDDAQRIGTLQNAEMQFARGLYEIQRGYNLNEVGKDDGEEEDKPICTGGTFNKIIESLVSIHPDAQITVITQESASSKLPIITGEEAIKYANSLVGQKRNELIRQLEADDTDSLWHAVKPMISQRFYEEFGSLYPDKDAKSYIEFIENAVWGLEAATVLESMKKQDTASAEINAEGNIQTDSVYQAVSTTTIMPPQEVVNLDQENTKPSPAPTMKDAAASEPAIIKDGKLNWDALKTLAFSTLEDLKINPNDSSTKRNVIQTELCATFHEAFKEFYTPKKHADYVEVVMYAPVKEQKELPSFIAIKNAALETLATLQKECQKEEQFMNKVYAQIKNLETKKDELKRTVDSLSNLSDTDTDKQRATNRYDAMNTLVESLTAKANEHFDLPTADRINDRVNFQQDCSIAIQEAAKTLQQHQTGWREALRSTFSDSAKDAANLSFSIFSTKSAQLLKETHETFQQSSQTPPLNPTHGNRF